MFHQAEKELTTLPGLRYSSGHRKGRLKILSLRWAELQQATSGERKAYAIALPSVFSPERHYAARVFVAWCFRYSPDCRSRHQCGRHGPRRLPTSRSEERRVGRECSARWAADSQEKE